MPINKWRDVGYTDDGCHEFECLSCYKRWESRSTPHDWKLCPCCGTKWEGFHHWDEDKVYDRKYGTYEQRRDGEKVGMFSSTAQWVIYRKEVYYEDDGIFQTDGWQRRDRYDVGHSFEEDWNKWSAKRVYAHLLYCRKEAAKEIREHDGFFGRLHSIEYAAEIKKDS